MFKDYPLLNEDKNSFAAFELSLPASQIGSGCVCSGCRAQRAGFWNSMIGGSTWIG